MHKFNDYWYVLTTTVIFWGIWKRKKIPQTTWNTVWHNCIWALQHNSSLLETCNFLPTTNTFCQQLLWHSEAFERQDLVQMTWNMAQMQIGSLALQQCVWNIWVSSPWQTKLLPPTLPGFASVQLFFLFVHQDEVSLWILTLDPRYSSCTSGHSGGDGQVLLIGILAYKSHCWHLLHAHYCEALFLCTKVTVLKYVLYILLIGQEFYSGTFLWEDVAEISKNVKYPV